MSAEIVQFIPRPNPKREAKLQQMAAEVFNAVLPAWPDVSSAGQ